MKGPFIYTHMPFTLLCPNRINISLWLVTVLGKKDMKAHVVIVDLEGKLETLA